MSNSALVSYVKRSPMNSGRRSRRIDTITIHHMAGNLSVETCGRVFQTRQASANYGVGSDGRIGLYVDEENRSWASSSADNDNRAVTIEVANCGGAPDWPVSDEAYRALIELLADICRRNGIKKLLWQGDQKLAGQVEKQNMTVHRWFMPTLCPGPHLMARMGDIAQKVNEKLGAAQTEKPSGEKPDGAAPYTVRVKVSDLRIRTGPGTNYSRAGTMKPGVYTIVDEAGGEGAKRWGKLKSGAGWIALDWTERT